MKRLEILKAFGKSDLGNTHIPLFNISYGKTKFAIVILCVAFIINFKSK